MTDEQVFKWMDTPEGLEAWQEYLGLPLGLYPEGGFREFVKSTPRYRDQYESWENKSHEQA